MAFCTECGAQLKDGSKFCAECGAATGVAPQSERRQVYDGEIHKCPNCGDILDAYESVCESCGYEIRGVKSTNSVRELQEKLGDLYSRRPFRDPHQHEKLSFGQWYRWQISQAQSMGQISSVDEEIISLIKTFPIPNTKEDIMEFVLLASSNIDFKSYEFGKSQYHQMNPSQRKISDAWLSKLKQAHQKAQWTFKNQEDLMKLQKIYEDVRKKINWVRWRKPAFITIIVLLVVIWFAWMVSPNPKAEAEEVERLEAIVREVEDALENEEYDLAMMNAKSIDYSAFRTNEELERQWDIKRDYLIKKTISEAAKKGILMEYPTDTADEKDQEKESEKTAKSPYTND